MSPLWSTSNNWEQIVSKLFHFLALSNANKSYNYIQSDSFLQCWWLTLCSSLLRQSSDTEYMVAEFQEHTFDITSFRLVWTTIRNRPTIFSTDISNKDLSFATQNQVTLNTLKGLIYTWIHVFVYHRAFNSVIYVSEELRWWHRLNLHTSPYLMYTNITLVTKHHFICVFTVRLKV